MKKELRKINQNLVPVAIVHLILHKIDNFTTRFVPYDV